MKCFFCQQDCQLAEYDGEWPPNDIWQCHHHNKIVKHYISDSYRIDGESYLNCVTIFWDYKDAKYSVLWLWLMPLEAEMFSRQAYWRLDKTFPKKDGYGRVIHELPFHPTNLTPENLEEKIPIWLTLL